MPTREVMPSLVWTHVSAYLPEAFDPVENAHFPTTKPRGGLWTSPVTETGSVWSRWAVNNGMYGQEDYLTYTPIRAAPGAKIAIIDTIESYEELRVQYPGRSHGTPESFDEIIEGLYKKFISTPAQKIANEVSPLIIETFDFKSMSRDFDAVWLADGPATDMKVSNYGLSDWDVETVLWMNTKSFIAGAPYQGTSLSRDDR